MKKSAKELKAIKMLIHEKCVDFANQRLSNVRSAINSASESANQETKSSAGDKHETGRAMLHLEQEQNTKQFAEAEQLVQQVNKINVERNSPLIGLGSLVITTKGNFYISIGAGKINIDEVIYFAISPQSPIANKLIGLKKSEAIAFNGQTIEIREVI